MQLELLLPNTGLLLALFRSFQLSFSKVKEGCCPLPIL